MLESMNVNDVDAGIIISIVKKKKKQLQKIHSTALASSSGFWVICTSHVYQRLIPTESDLDGLLHWTCALPDYDIKSNYVQIKLKGVV